ncbi:UNVERIFIED_CONTAM: CD2 antigen cytoplasmic tail-binding protein 2 [Siphonaria sp. JEL0065]|nr:CD2 antigen cytoplasmic tail-binding protein 2 [Siphonaria sp. JEL0065]
MKRGSTDDAGIINKKKVKFESKPDSFVAVDGQDDEDLEFGARKRKGIKQGYTDSDDEDGGGADSDEDSDKEGDKKEGGEDDMFAEEQEKKSKFLPKEKVDLEGAEKDFDQDLEGGVHIMPFNMDDELNEGAFDENYNYVRDKDEHESHDKWLGGISNSDIKKAKVASDRMKARVEALDALDEEVADENASWKSVLRLMKPRESVAATLKRLGGPKKAPAWKKNLKKKAVEATPKADDESPQAESTRKRDLSDLITITDRLTSLGRYDVMEQTYESIVRVLRIANILPEDWQHGDHVPGGSSPSSSDASKVLWEYKVGKDSEDLLGPFPAAQMVEWKGSGLFDQPMQQQQQSESVEEVERGKVDASNQGVWVRLVVANTPLDTVKNFVPLSYVNLTTGEGAIM